MSAFRLVVITPPSPATPRELEVVQRLFGSGLKTLHVRKPGAAADDLASYLQTLPRDLRKRCMLHSHHQLSKRIGVGGVHYTERDRPVGAIKAPPGLAVSTSLHALPDLLVCRGDLDYAFLSPIYDSISKQGYNSSFSSDQLESGLAGSRHPVLALGGVTPDKFSELASLGFAGAALLGYVWQAEDPVAAFEAALAEAERVSAELS